MEKAKENRIPMKAWSALQKNDSVEVDGVMSFNDLSVDCIEAFFKSMNYEFAMRHNSANHLRQLFHYLYNRGITVTDNLPSTGRMCAGYRQLNDPKPASN